MEDASESVSQCFGDFAFGAQLIEDDLQLRQPRVDGSRLQTAAEQNLRSHCGAKRGRKSRFSLRAGAVDHNEIADLVLVRAQLLMDLRDERNVAARTFGVLSRRRKVRARVRVNDLIVRLLRVAN